MINSAPGTSATISGTISNGGITKTGTGTLQLTGNTSNTYSGATTIDAGTLTLAKSANTTATDGSVIINNSSSTLALSGSDQTIPDLIFNAGSYNDGGVALNLTSGGTALSMQGSTTIPGQLNLTGGGAISFTSGTPSITGIDLGGSTCIIDSASSTSATVSGIISNGAVTKTGAGELIFSGSSSNTYSGLTTISEGTLILSKPPLFENTLGATSVSGDVLINGGTLFNATANQFGPTSSLEIDSGTWDLNTLEQTLQSLTINGGNLINNSLLNLSGSGTVLTLGDFTLQGAINLTGSSPSTVIFYPIGGGTAQIDQIDLGSSDRTFNVPKGGATSDMTLVSGSSSGGGLIKTGNGTLSLTGANMYTGASQLLDGTLLITGELNSSSFYTAPMTVLAGNGMIYSNSQIDGILRPGLSIGTITFNGDVVLGSSSILEIELNPSEIDLLEIKMGALTIQDNATVFFMPMPTIYPDELLLTLIQTTNGVDGEFGNVLNSFPAYDVQFYYTDLAVILGVETIPFSDLGLTGNPKSVGVYLDKQDPAPDSDLSFVIGTIRLETSEKAISNDLNKLHPAPLKGLSLAAENGAIATRSSILLHNGITYSLCCPKKRSTCPKTPFSAWTDVQGSFFSQGSQGENIGFSNDAILASIGGDYQIGSCLGMGVAATYHKASLNWHDRQDKGTVNGAYGSLYSTWQDRDFLINAVIMGGWNRYYTMRHIDFLTIDRRARSTFCGWQVLGHLDGTYFFDGKSKAKKGFFASLDYSNLHQDKFREKGANSINLEVKATNYALLSSEIGLILSSSSSSCNWGCFLLQPRLSYIREDRFGGTKYRAKMQEAVGYFRTEGLQPDRNLIAPALRLAFYPYRRPATLFFEYQGEWGKKYWNHNIHLGLQF